MHVYPFYIYCKYCNIPVHTCTYNVNSLKMNGRTCVKQLIYSSSGSRKLIEILPLKEIHVFQFYVFEHLS